MKEVWRWIMKRIIQFITIVLVFILVPKENVFAEESGFSVRPILPKEQLTKVPYFHLSMEPGKSKTLEVLLKNHQKEPIAIQIDSANGFSNPYGNMNYTKDEKTEYSLFLNDDYKMVNIIENQEKITLKPYEEKVISFKLHLPNDINRGEALGGIQFQAYVEQDNNSKSNSNEKAAFAVKIKHRYTIGVLVQLPQKVKSEIKIKDSFVTTATKTPQILTEFWNENPIITKDVVFEYAVTRKGGNEILFQGQKDLYNFAPVTSMKVPVDWAYKNFEKGDYNIEIKLKDKKTNKVFQAITNEFEVGSKKVVEYAKRSGENNSIVPNAILVSKWIYVIFTFMVVGLFWLGYLLGRKNKENRELKNKGKENNEEKE